MGLCIALLSGPLDVKVMANWTNVDFFKPHILHAEPLVNVDTADNKLRAAPFEIPPSIDPLEIAGIAIISCESGIVDTRYGFQVPAVGISCLENANVFCVTGVCAEAQTIEEIYETDCTDLLDPCALYEELRCCYIKLIKDKCVVQKMMDGDSVRYQPFSDSDKHRLKQEMMEAEAECRRCSGEQTFFRGGHLGRSCAKY